MVVCLTSARFNMKADILRPADSAGDAVSDGEWITRQDPDSGEIVRKWVSNPSDPVEYVDSGLESFDCIARGIVDGGIRVAGTTERFGDLYENVDYVRITFPPGVVLNRRDRVTNIRTRDGIVVWREEERQDQAPTVFSVNGVTPIIDPFGRHIENMALLERAEGQ